MIVWVLYEVVNNVDKVLSTHDTFDDAIQRRRELRVEAAPKVPILHIRAMEDI